MQKILEVNSKNDIIKDLSYYLDSNIIRNIK